MSKKALSILLLLPFILSIFFFVTSSFLFTKIDGDITNITWEYKNQEAFSLASNKIKLDASPVLANNQIDTDATLIWTVSNVNKNEEPHAEIVIENNVSYLVFRSIGDVIVTCTNSSGNISKSFNVKIFVGSIITINTARTRSYQSIEDKDYYGLYDLSNNQKEKATFYLDVEVKKDTSSKTAFQEYQVETSSNILFDKSTGRVLINNPGESYIKCSLPSDSNNYETYEFTVVNDGINVYSYNDLLYCTNKSLDGEIVCLQTNLESLKNTYNLNNDSYDVNSKKDSSTELFGNYNSKNKSFSFNDEVYRFESTYNTEFIDQYNAQSNSTSKLSKEILAGIHIQKDFYGNGFTINAHNLTYPTGEINVGDKLATLQPSDLFRGPLPFVIIGNPEAPLVESYGQDNIGFYVDGDNILLNDVVFKNCDFSNILQNNDTTGTVVEVNGNNVTIKNSYISSGRTVLRAFSTSNLLVKNSLLEKGREFIAKIGSNEYEKMDMDEILNITIDEEQYNIPRSECFNQDNDLCVQDITSKLLMNGVGSDSVSYKELTPYVPIIQDIFNPKNAVQNDYGDFIFKGDVTFEDTYFYQSGLFSIGIESQFNGPYLYDGNPVRNYLDTLVDGIIYPDNIGGISYPTITYLKGDTRFYDYKTIDQMDANCLVHQDVSSLAGKALDLDEFFPIKKLFLKEAQKKNYTHISSEQSYLSTAIAKYGGANNYSIIDASSLNNNDELMNDIFLDTFTEAMTAAPKGSTIEDLLPFMLQRCVPMATGFAPFNIMMYNGHKTENSYLFGEQIQLNTLRSRA